MFNSVEFVRDICRKRNIAISQLEKDCGFSNGYLNPKKMTKIPYERALIIGKYLNISPYQIMYGEDAEKENPPALNARDKRDIARDLEEMMEHLDSAGDLMFDGDPMSDEARATIRSAMQLGLEAAKLKNKERFTPNKYKKG